MAKKARAAPAQTLAESDAIAAAIHRLADSIIVLRDAIAVIREDIQWVTHNGLPLQPIVHTAVKRMARDPCAADWSKKLAVECYSYPPDASAEADDEAPLDGTREEFASTIEAVAEGQLEVILTALDGVRNEIFAALKQRNRPGPDPPRVPAAEEPAPPTATGAVPDPPRPTIPRDRLF